MLGARVTEAYFHDFENMHSIPELESMCKNICQSQLKN